MSIFSRVKRTFASAKSKIKTGASKVLDVAKTGLAAAAAPFIQSSGRSTLPKSQPNYKGLNVVEKDSYTPTNYSNDLLSSGIKSGGLQFLSGGSTGGLYQPNRNSYGGSGSGNSLTQSSLTSYGLSPIYRSSSRSASPILYGGLQNISGGSFPSFKFAPGTPLTSKTIGLSTPISSSSISASPAVVLPSRPVPQNPGKINNGGLIGNGYTVDPTTNMLVSGTQVAPQPSADAESSRRLSIQKMFQELIPQKDSVLADKDVKRQQKEVIKQQQEVANYTAQLNSIVAQQNADLLSTRGTASKEGVTEAVYGGIEAEINREAAIKALPVQAALSAAQGNLEIAQDYLTQLTTWKKEQIDNDYNYKVALVDSVKEFLTGEEKIRADKIKEDSQRAWEIMKMNISDQDEWARTAMSKGHTNLVQAISNLDPGSPYFREQLGALTSRITSSDSSGSVVSYFTKSQIANGAAASGMSVSDFKQLSVDEANRWINGADSGLVDGRLPASDLVAHKASLKKLVDEGSSRSDIEQMLSEANLPPADELALLLYLDEIKPISPRDYTKLY